MMPSTIETLIGAPAGVGEFFQLPPCASGLRLERGQATLSIKWFGRRANSRDAPPLWRVHQGGITVIPVYAFYLDPRKSRRLRANPRRGIGFEEAQELFSHPYWLDQRSDVPEQFLAIGRVGDRLYSVIF